MRRGQGDIPAPLQFPPALILRKHQGSQICHARQAQAHINQWPVPHGQTPLLRGHLMPPSQASLAAGLYWPLTGPATSWLRASCFSSEEWCCGHRKVTAPNSRGPLEGTSTLWNSQHGLSVPVGPPWLRWGGGPGIHRASVRGQGDASVTGPLSRATAPRIK